MNTSHQQKMDMFTKAGLYLVTSQDFSLGRQTLDIVKQALAGGVKLIQLREKDMPIRDLAGLAIEARALTREHNALLIINDRIDIALAVEADGVHLGQNDLPIDMARKIAPDLIIGASTHSVSEALAAEREGASYANIGPLFPTGTKEHHGEYLGIDGLREISSRISIPFTVMGGIKEHHIPDLLSAGARTIALVTAVTAEPEVEDAARRLLELIRQA